MSTPSPFRFPVSDLLAGGERRAVVVDASVDWSLELSRLGPALHAELTLEGASGGILVRGWAETEATHRAIGAIFSEETLRSATLAAGADSPPHPVFVAGMPRSERTLLEQMLDSHTHVAGGGDPITRVGLTAMQVMGVPISRWGTKSLQTDKTVTEILV